MSYVYVIRHEKTKMDKRDIFNDEIQTLAQFAKVISHPARLAILKYLAETKTCISGDISNHLPLSRTTVSQHLKELKSFGLIKGEIDGLKVNYCLNYPIIEKNFNQLETYFKPIRTADVQCNTEDNNN